MPDLAELLDTLNAVDRLDELWGTARYGPLHRFLIPRDSGWSGYLVESFLRRYGIPIWGRGFAQDSLYFSVKRRQANWAEYLLKRRGIPVSSAPYNPKNDEYALRHAPGDEPPGWRSRPAKSPVGRKTSWLDDLSRFLGLK